MRNSKIVALVAAAALLVVGAAFTAFAATGWVEESGSWKYYDKNGEEVTEAWAKSGADWYWLDEDGYLATDALVDEDTYYVDGAGKMVKNQWVAIENTDDEDGYADEIWYYFQGSGKVLKAATGYAKKTVNGKKYIFDENGRMQFGWVSFSEGMIDDSDNTAWQNQDAEGVYYCGSNDDGHVRVNEWENLYIDDAGDDSYAWFYFDNNGKKLMDKFTKTINGKKYAFDEYGRMVAEWGLASGATASDIANYGWFQDAETGAKFVNGWFKVVPAASVNEADNTDEASHWYFADGKGNLKKETIFSWNGKKYAANGKGEMLTGLQWVTYDTATGAYTFKSVSVDPTDATNYNIDDITTPGQTIAVADGKTGLYFFSDDEDNDGSMKTGATKADVDGDATAFKFYTKGTKKGTGLNGKDGSYFYVNGKKVVADGDLKVQAFEADADGKLISAGVSALDAKANLGSKKYALVTSSGVIVKKGTKTDADGYKFTVKNGFIETIVATD